VAYRLINTENRNGRENSAKCCQKLNINGQPILRIIIRWHLENESLSTDIIICNVNRKRGNLYGGCLKAGWRPA